MLKTAVAQADLKKIIKAVWANWTCTQNKFQNIWSRLLGNKPVGVYDYVDVILCLDLWYNFHSPFVLCPF